MSEFLALRARAQQAERAADANAARVGTLNVQVTDLTAALRLAREQVVWLVEHVADDWAPEAEEAAQADLAVIDAALGEQEDVGGGASGSGTRERVPRRKPDSDERRTGHGSAPPPAAAPEIVMDARGIYWRCYPEHLSMVPTSDDNLPVPYPWVVYRPAETRFGEQDPT